MNETLNALYELQRLDSALAVATRRQKALDPGLAEQSAAESAKAVHERSVRASHESARDLQDAELELKSIEAKKIDYDHRLASGKGTWKELEQFKHEVDALGRQRASLDEKILVLMDQIEERRKAEEEARIALEKAEAALVAKQAEYKKSSKVLASQIKTLTAERQQKATTFAAPIMKRYEAIRVSKGGIGISKIDGDSCLVCHTNLPSEVIETVIKTDRIETCPNCGRLLCVGA